MDNVCIIFCWRKFFYTNFKMRFKFVEVMLRVTELLPYVTLSCIELKQKYFCSATHIKGKYGTSSESKSLRM